MLPRPVAPRDAPVQRVLLDILDAVTQQPAVPQLEGDEPAQQAPPAGRDGVVKDGQEHARLRMRVDPGRPGSARQVVDGPLRHVAER
jgi:hypothetical protein